MSEHIETPEETAAFFSDPQWLHLATLMNRPNVWECSTEVENTHYAPMTPRNDLYNIRKLEWEGLMWAIISIPAGDRKLFEHIATKHGIRIADGTPTMVSSAGVSRFPLDLPNVFTLENSPEWYEARKAARGKPP